MAATQVVSGIVAAVCIAMAAGAVSAACDALTNASCSLHDATGAPIFEARRIPAPFPPSPAGVNGEHVLRQRHGTAHSVTVLLPAVTDALADGLTRFERSARVLGYKVQRAVPDSIANLATDKGSIILAVAEPANALLTHDPIRLMALFRSQPKSLLLSTPETPLAVVGYADAILAHLQNVGAGSLWPLSQFVTYDDVAVDSKQQLFLTLDAPNALADDTLRLEMASDRDEADPRLVITATDSEPAIVLAQGDGLATLDVLSNYVPLAWTPRDGCVTCRERAAHAAASSASLAAEANLPHVHVAVVITAASPFLALALNDLSNQNYPGEKMHVNALILPGSRQELYADVWATWTATVGVASTSITLLTEDDSLATAVALTVSKTATDQGKFLLHHAHARLTNNETLRYLVSTEVHAVAPMLTRQKLYWSNFWGSASQLHDTTAAIDAVAYLRSFDYFNLVRGERRGLWTVPLAFGSVLYSHEAAVQVAEILAAQDAAADLADANDFGLWRLQILLARELRRQGMFFRVDNTMQHGHLINANNFDASRLHPDLYLVVDNPAEWEELYLNTEYDNYAKHGFISDCNDVFRVPIFSPTFSQELIAECENFGQWSGGDNKDERLQGGYEPVPTQDIHFTQIGFREAWRAIIKTYLRPITAYHYPGYTLEGDKTLDFVVRYRPDKQSFLRPHHDASTVTLNVALNQGSVDYEGGGTRFIRQNCTLKDTAPGWGAISPGRLTHLHEGLRTTAGTRYILVSFIDQ